MSNPSPIEHVPTMAEIRRIAALTDPVMRNLHITQCYHELALIMARRTGLNANWCVFATWASRQAGQTIRKEDFSRMLENLLQATPTSQALSDITVSAQALGSTRSSAEIEESVGAVLNPLAAFDRASDAVARGNRKVFDEIGYEFARFYATRLQDPTFDADAIAHFCEALRPGEPPEGQDYLRMAFTHYYRALFESDPKVRAELMLLANIEIGLHEQTRLQPEIAEAMSAAFVDRRAFRRRLITALFPHRGWLIRIRLFLLRVLDRPSPLDAAFDVLLAEARRRMLLIITEYLMTIDLAGARLRLGEDVPAGFPDALQHITLPELIMLLDQADPTPDSTRESGTINWADLPDRLHFIIDMFRCYHETVALFEPPFTTAQVAALKAGHLPEGRL